MLDRRRKQGPHVPWRSNTEKPPSKTREYNEPRKQHRRQSPDETRNQVVVRHCASEPEQDGGIAEGNSGPAEVVEDPPNGPLILQGLGLVDVLVYEPSSEKAQEPSTDGCASSSSPPGNLQLDGNQPGDVHHYCADQAAQHRPIEQVHEIPPITTPKKEPIRTCSTHIRESSRMRFCERGV